MGAPIRNPVMRFVVYSHLWLALGAAAQTWWMGEVLDAVSWRAPVLAFCGTIVCYAYMRWARMDHPDLAASPHLKWCRENKRIMLGLATACAAGGTVVAWPYAGELVKAFWPVALIGLLYVIPLSLTGGRTIGLRRIPALKALLIAFVWARVTVMIPITLDGRTLGEGNEFWLNYTWVLVVQFAFFFALALAFDLRDIAFDGRNLRTLPQVLGPMVTGAFAVAFILPWISMLMLRVLFLASASPLGDMLAILGFIVTLCLIARASKDRSEAYFSVLLDGTLTLIPLLGWLGSLIG